MIAMLTEGRRTNGAQQSAGTGKTTHINFINAVLSGP